MKTTLIFKLIMVTIGVTVGDIFLFAISDTVIVSIITGFFSLASLALTLLIKSRIEKVDVKVDAYHKEVDGMKTALVEAVKGKGEAEGNLKGRIEQTQELKDAVAEVKAENIIVTTDQASVTAANVTVAKDSKAGE